MSFHKHMKPAMISAQIRMERQKHKGTFLLIEGPNDSKRFRKIFDEASCSFVVCYGKGNVTGCIDIEQNNGRDDCLGFVDADFERILGTLVANEDVIVSQSHDFDLDTCSSPAVERYLIEVGDQGKVHQHGGHAACVQSLLLALKPLSVLRYANERHQLGYKLEGLELDTFFDGSATDIPRMVDHVSRGSFSSPAHKASLRGHIEQYLDAELDLWQLTNGHDFMAALGIALRARLGNRHPSQTWRTEVERHLRLAVDANDLHGVGTLPLIEEWQQRCGRNVLRTAQ